MHTHPVLLAAGALLLGVATPAARAITPDREQLLSRGRYLVENVGLCSDCHSPRNERGEFIRERWLTGSAILFSPSIPIPWAPASPPIAGLPTMTESQAVAFLQTGVRPDGSQPRPPMPPFRFSESDANAVVAYLKSLAK